MSFFCESSVRGYHEYKQCQVFIGEILNCREQKYNPHDEFAVEVTNQDGETIGHVPIEISRFVHLFLVSDGEVDAEVIGSRFNVGEGKGLEIPVDYKFYGSYLYLKKLRRELKTAVKGINCSSVVEEWQPYFFNH